MAMTIVIIVIMKEENDGDDDRGNEGGERREAGARDTARGIMQAATAMMTMEMPMAASHL